MTDLSGHCLCGATKWRYSGPVTRRLVCHCTDCQRATSSPFTAFIGLHPDKLKWDGSPNHYESSPGSHRGFCPTCGTRLYFRSDKWPDEIHLHAATLDDPEIYQPDAHVCLSDSPAWVMLDDTVDKHESFQMPPYSEKEGS